MAKDAFNSASSQTSKNSVEPPKFYSGFVPDKKGRIIKTVEDFSVAERRTADGRKVRYRAGKVVSEDPLPVKKDQDDKKAVMTSQLDRQSQRTKQDLSRKAKNHQL